MKRIPWRPTRRVPKRRSIGRPARRYLGLPAGLKTVQETEENERIRRNSRMLNLDDLPTLDLKKSSDAQMAELKAAFDRLGEGGDSDISPGRRRRSLSAPDLLVRSPVKTSGPSFLDSDDESDEAASSGGATATPIARPDSKKVRTPQEEAAVADAAQLQRFRRLKALKRGSMSGMDLTRMMRPLGKSVTDLKAEGGPIPVAVTEPGSRTPPRPGRKAPALTASDPSPVVFPAASNKAPAPTAGGSGALTEKPVLRQSHSVVLEESDEDEESPIAVISTMLKLGGKPAEMVESQELRMAAHEEEDDDDLLSSSDDVGEDPSSVQKIVDPMSKQRVVLEIPAPALSSGDVTPQGQPTSGEVTPKSIQGSVSAIDRVPPAPEKAMISPFARGTKREGSPEADSPLAAPAVSAVRASPADEKMKTPLLKAMNAHASTSEQNGGDEDDDHSDQDEDSQEASFEP